MSYYAEMQRQTTIGQLAAVVLIGSGIALAICLVSLFRMDYPELDEIAWTGALTAVAVVAMIGSSRMARDCFAKAALVRARGGDRSLA
jgi:hypothetical protein